MKMIQIKLSDDLSIRYSTTNVADFRGAVVRKRRRLQMSALGLGSMFAIHCRIGYMSVTGGFTIFLLLLIPATVVLGNMMRHFEVYLGQWSISGPGRAFRILPSLDGIGLAICVHAILRAIVSCGFGALTLLYVLHSLSDKKLPYLTCRDFNLVNYPPNVEYVAAKLLSEDPVQVLFDLRSKSLKNFHKHNASLDRVGRFRALHRPIYTCKETYPRAYPPVVQSPSYNFFYVELGHYRPDHSPVIHNTSLLISSVVVYGVLWLMLMIEKLGHGMIKWNYVQTWILIIPWIWSVLLIYTSLKVLLSHENPTRLGFKLTHNKEFFNDVADAFLTSLFIHSAGLGTEIVHGKGLNHFAGGHIDSKLNGENIWHSILLIILTSLSSLGSTICALSDYTQENQLNNVQFSTLWILPMFGKCVYTDNGYSHFISALLYSGLTLAYLTVALACFKTALHTIFEYNVNLIVYEHLVATALVTGCMLFSFSFTNNSGLLLLECLETLTTRIALPLVCAIESVAMIYIYRNTDFISDMNVATEENTCSGRISRSWHIMPFLCLIITAVQIAHLINSQMPSDTIAVASMAIVILVLTVPLRAARNAYKFIFPISLRRRRQNN